jgi:hypothetical protein
MKWQRVNEWMLVTCSTSDSDEESLRRTCVMQHLPVALSRAAMPTSLPVPRASSTAVIHVPSTDSVSALARLGGAVGLLGALIGPREEYDVVMFASELSRVVVTLDMTVEDTKKGTELRTQ